MFEKKQLTLVKSSKINIQDFETVKLFFVIPISTVPFIF